MFRKARIKFKKANDIDNQCVDVFRITSSQITVITQEGVKRTFYASEITSIIFNSI